MPQPKRPLGVTRPAIADLVAIAVMVLMVVAGGVRLTQSDGDLFAHIAMGRWILDLGAIPRGSLFGTAPSPAPFVAPAWGGATVFALLDRVGGLPLIAAFTAALAGATHGALASYWKLRGVPAALVVLASMLGMVLAATHWLARPHIFSLAASALLVILMEPRGRPALRPLVAIPALFFVWANLHGGWAFGLVILGGYTAGTLADAVVARSPEQRARGVALLGAMTVATLATFATPYGANLHIAIVRTLTDPAVSGVIDEYQPPSWREPGDLLFFALLGACAFLLWRSRRRLPQASLLVLAICTLFALRAGRNISLFGVTAWPLVASHLAPAATRWWRHSSLAADLARYDAPRGAGRWSAAVLTLLLIVGALRGRVGGASFTESEVDPRRFPVAAVEALRREGSNDGLLTTWSWSGYVPYAWPGRRTYFDPLAFQSATVSAFGTMLLARDGWRRELAANGIERVMLPPGVPLADSLRNDPAWRTAFQDETAIVMQQSPAARGRRPE